MKNNEAAGEGQTPHILQMKEEEKKGDFEGKRALGESSTHSQSQQEMERAPWTG